jgi:two-component system, LytTR family, response regulator
MIPVRLFLYCKTYKPLKMLNCLIVDDEQHAIDVLLHYAKQVPYLHVVASCTNPLEALRIVNEQEIDLIFLDIQMPHMTGLDFARTIPGKAKIVLTTAYSEFAVEGFDLDVVDYLLKPIALTRFLKAVQRVLNIQSSSDSVISLEDSIDDDYMFVKTEQKGKVLKINLKDIDYIEGMKNYVSIHHNNQKTLALLNMKDLELRLPNKFFVRIHKSFIVAVNKVTAIEGSQVRLKNVYADIVMGDSYRNKLLDIMKSKLMQ